MILTIFQQPCHTSIDEYVSEEISELTSNLTQRNQLSLVLLTKKECWTRRYSNSVRQKMLYPKTHKQLRLLNKKLSELRL